MCKLNWFLRISIKFNVLVVELQRSGGVAYNYLLDKQQA